jgi:hypothetical protein
MLRGLPISKTGLTFRVALNKAPNVGDFIKDLIADNPQITSGPSCENKGLTIKITALKDRVEGDQAAPKDRYLDLSEEDLGFAKNDPAKTPIWPIIVRKLAEDIDKQHPASAVKGWENGKMNGLLMNVKGDDRFDCWSKPKLAVVALGEEEKQEDQVHKRQYLCTISDLVSRLLGIRLQSTGIVRGGTSSKDADLRAIFAGAKDNFAIVFEDWSPRYLVTSDENTNPGDGDNNAKERKFNAVKLDIVKHGRSWDMNYELTKIGDPGIYDYKQIMNGGEGRDTHIVYKYGNFKKA